VTGPGPHLLDELPGQPEEYYLAPDKLIDGNPRQSVWMQYTDPSGQFFVGVWESEVGKWSISYTEEEYFQVLEGRSVITADGGEAVEVGAGDSMVIGRGFVGTWEVIEPTRKTFVIYEAAAG
jgi:uncharacterized protein